MEGKNEKVLDSSEISSGNLKRKWSSNDARYLQSARPCSTNDCKQHLMQKSILENYSNFLKSDLPKRLLFHEDGEWNDHPMHIIGLIHEDFQAKRAITEVTFEGRHLLFDFVHMVQIETEACMHKPLAWIDRNDSCFFPELHHCYGSPVDYNPTRAKNGSYKSSLLSDLCEIQTSAGTCSSCKKIKTMKEPDGLVDHSERREIVESVGENELHSFFPSKYSHFDVFHGKLSRLADGGKAYTTVEKMLLLGMGSLIDRNDISGIFSIPPSSLLAQTRLSLFQKKVKVIADHRGNANLRYGWLPCSKDGVEEVMLHGLEKIGKPIYHPMYGTGFHLTPASRSNISADCSDVDENGLRHMVLCRIILGNLERVHPRSRQFEPSNGSYDNGVDDIQNPNHYIIWDINVKTHILPEYVVSFRICSKAENGLGKQNIYTGSGQKNPDSFNSQLQGHAGNIKVENDQQVCSSVEHSKESNYLHGRIPRPPTSPWMPFSMLFAAISAKVTTHEMDLINVHYDKFKRKALSRIDLIKRLREIIGDKLLISTIKHLQKKLPPTMGRLESQKL